MVGKATFLLTESLPNLMSTTTRRLNAEEYRLLVEQAPIMIWRADLGGGCDYFNQRWLDFRGRTMEQEAGNGWAEGVHPDDFEKCLRTYMDAFAVQQTFEMEYRLLRADGRWRWIFDRGVPIYGPDGTFAGYTGSCTDVTERVEAQLENSRLKELELKHLRGLLPICADCKRIRNDEGYWQQVEEYLMDHSEARFSHGLCHECLPKYFPKQVERGQAG